MKMKMKRFLGIALAIVMLLGMLPMMSLADTEDVGETPETTEATVAPTEDVTVPETTDATAANEETTAPTEVDPTEADSTEPTEVDPTVPTEDDDPTEPTVDNDPVPPAKAPDADDPTIESPDDDDDDDEPTATVLDPIDGMTGDTQFYKMTTLDQLAATGKYIIVGQNGSDYYALIPDADSGTYYASTVKITNMPAGDAGLKVDTSAPCVLTATKSTKVDDAWKFQTSMNYGLRLNQGKVFESGSSSNIKFTEDSNSTWKLMAYKDDGTATRGLTWNGSSFGVSSSNGTVGSSLQIWTTVAPAKCECEDCGDDCTCLADGTNCGSPDCACNAQEDDSCKCGEGEDCTCAEGNCMCDPCGCDTCPPERVELFHLMTDESELQADQYYIIVYRDGSNSYVLTPNADGNSTKVPYELLPYATLDKDYVLEISQENTDSTFNFRPHNDSSLGLRLNKDSGLVFDNTTAHITLTASFDDTWTLSAGSGRNLHWDNTSSSFVVSANMTAFQIFTTAKPDCKCDQDGECNCADGGCTCKNCKCENCPGINTEAFHLMTDLSELKAGNRYIFVYHEGSNETAYVLSTAATTNAEERAYKDMPYDVDGAKFIFTLSTSNNGDWNFKNSDQSIKLNSSGVFAALNSAGSIVIEKGETEGTWLVKNATARYLLWTGSEFTYNKGSDITKNPATSVEIWTDAKSDDGCNCKDDECNCDEKETCDCGDDCGCLYCRKGALTFYPMTNITQLQPNEHYIIVTAHTGDEETGLIKMDALSADGTGYMTVISRKADSNILQALESDLFVLELTRLNSMVISTRTGGVRLQAEPSVALKLGTDSATLDTMFDTKGGDLTIKQYTAGANAWRVSNGSRYLYRNGDSYAVRNGIGYIPGTNTADEMDVVQIWTTAKPLATCDCGDGCTCMEGGTCKNDDGTSTTHDCNCPFCQLKDFSPSVTKPEPGNSYTDKAPDGATYTQVKSLEQLADLNGPMLMVVEENGQHYALGYWQMTVPNLDDNGNPVYSYYIRDLGGTIWLYVAGKDAQGHTLYKDSLGHENITIDFEYYEAEETKGNLRLKYSDADYEAHEELWTTERDPASGSNVKVKRYFNPTNPQTKLVTYWRFPVVWTDIGDGTYTAAVDPKGIDALNAEWDAAWNYLATTLEDDIWVYWGMTKAGNQMVEENAVLKYIGDAFGSQNDVTPYYEFTNIQLASTYYNYYFAPQSLTPSNSYYTGTPFRPSRNGRAAAAVRFLMAESGEGQETKFYVRGNGATTWLCADGSYNYSAGNGNGDPRVQVEIYSYTVPDDYTAVKFMESDHETEYSVSLVAGPDKYVTLIGEMEEVEHEGQAYTFVGWTLDETQNTFLTLEESCGIFDFNSSYGTGTITEEAKAAYKLLGTCNPMILWRITLQELLNEIATLNTLSDEPVGVAEPSEIKLYPVYARKSFDSAVAAFDGDTGVVGISDWKDLQGGVTTRQDRDKWISYITVNIYKDGELWVESQPLYFSYHDDNAADLNLKWLDGNTDASDASALYQFMSKCGPDAFPETSPVGAYVIDAVIAEQGAGESGMKYDYNWMTTYGGQLDNVHGASLNADGTKKISVVDVYVTTLYNVRYYLDDEPITAPEWVNDRLYATKGTEDAFAAKSGSRNVQYPVTASNLNGLMDRNTKTVNDGKGHTSTHFNDGGKMERGKYYGFSYQFGTYDHVFEVAESPEELVPADRSMDSIEWTLKGGPAGEAGVAWASDYEVGGKGATSYKTGNTGYAYQDTPTAIAYTYHLHAYTKTGYISVTKNVTGTAGEKNREFTFTVTLDKPFTGESGDMNFVNGVAVFTLKHGETKTSGRLPEGIKFTVVESNNEGYKVTITADGDMVVNRETRAVLVTNHKDAPTENPKTGDTNNPVLWTALMAVSLVGIIGVFLLSKASVKGKYRK